jgi:hypothetical protein
MGPSCNTSARDGISFPLLHTDKRCGKGSTPGRTSRASQLRHKGRDRGGERLSCQMNMLTRNKLTKPLGIQMVTRWVISFGLALFIWADAPIFRWPGLNSRVMILCRCLVLSPLPVSQLRKEIARRTASAAPTNTGDGWRDARDGLQKSFQGESIRRGLSKFSPQ